MFTYTLRNPKPLGNDDPTYGQKYWASAEGVDTAVSFNLTGGQTVHDGSTITAEVSENRFTKEKNTPYQLLRKVKVQDGALPQVGQVISPQAITTNDFAKPGQAANPMDVGAIENRLQRIEEKVDKLLGLDDPEQSHAAAEAKRDAANFNTTLDETFPEGYDQI